MVLIVLTVIQIKNMTIFSKRVNLRTKKALAGLIFSVIFIGVVILGARITKADKEQTLPNNPVLTLPIIQKNTLLAVLSPQPVIPVRKINMVITAYSSTPEETDNTPFITASGQTVKDGIAANNLLPFGTKIKIPDLYGDKIFEIQDRMNQRKGIYQLDLWFPSHKEAEKFGAKITYVEVLRD